jgi:uncharacterized protein (TIGR03083 family)
VTDVDDGFNQNAITTALFDEWAVIDALLAGLDETQWRLPVPLPAWDVHATVAHVIGTESLFFGIAAPPAGAVATEHVRNPTGTFNEQWVAGLRELSGAQLLDRFRDITARRRAVLGTLSARRWAEPVPDTPVGNVSYGRFMQVRLFDCWMHELDIRDGVGLPGDEGGARGALAFDEITPNLGYTIGKRGKAPVGSRIALHLTGPLARDIYLEVPERAQLVPALDRPPTVALTLDSGLFARLYGGRTSAAAHADAIAVTGDRTLGLRLLDNLATTI